MEKLPFPTDQSRIENLPNEVYQNHEFNQNSRRKKQHTVNLQRTDFTIWGDVEIATTTTARSPSCGFGFTYLLNAE